jgi:hypothetical protein
VFLETDLHTFSTNEGFNDPPSGPSGLVNEILLPHAILRISTGFQNELDNNSVYKPGISPCSDRRRPSSRPLRQDLLAKNPSFFYHNFLAWEKGSGFTQSALGLEWDATPNLTIPQLQQSIKKQSPWTLHSRVRIPTDLWHLCLIRDFYTCPGALHYCRRSNFEEKISTRLKSFRIWVPPAEFTTLSPRDIFVKEDSSDIHHLVRFYKKVLRTSLPPRLRSLSMDSHLVIANQVFSFFRTGTFSVTPPLRGGKVLAPGEDRNQLSRDVYRPEGTAPRSFNHLTRLHDMPTGNTLEDYVKCNTQTDTKGPPARKRIRQP